MLQPRREPEKAESLEKTTGLAMPSDSQDGQSGSEEIEQGWKGQQGSFQTLVSCSDIRDFSSVQWES